MARLVLVLGLLTSVAGQLERSPDGSTQRSAALPPILTSSWIATGRYFSVDRIDGGSDSITGNFTMVQDPDQSVLIHIKNYSFVPAQWVGTPLGFYQYRQFITSSFAGVEFNGQKMPEDGRISPQLLSWLAQAQDVGIVEFEGQPAHKWFARVKSPSSSQSYALFVDLSGRPLVVQQNRTTGPDFLSELFRFSSFTWNATDPSIWSNFSKEEFEHPPLCPQHEERLPLRNLTLYLFHPANNFDIAGQDLADQFGDTTFVCSDALQNYTVSAGPDYRWVTQWLIEVLPLFGQYQNCNGYPTSCLGANDFYVGHEAASYMGGPPMERQCGSNPLVGEWYSLPVKGECQGAAVPGDGTCTWRKVSRVKTIEGHCLHKDRETFRHLCALDGRAPFKHAAARYERAFASSNPEEGGCPPISAEDLAQSVVV